MLGNTHMVAEHPHGIPTPPPASCCHADLRWPRRWPAAPWPGGATKRFFPQAILRHFWGPFGIEKALEKAPSLGNQLFLWAMFNSYVKLPEGNRNIPKMTRGIPDFGMDVGWKWDRSGRNVGHILDKLGTIRAIRWDMRSFVGISLAPYWDDWDFWEPMGRSWSRRFGWV